MIEWLLVGYGTVLSTPPLVDQLTGVDVRGWLRLNCLSLLTRRAARAS